MDMRKSSIEHMCAKWKKNLNKELIWVRSVCGEIKNYIRDLIVVIILCDKKYSVRISICNVHSKN